MKLLILYLLLTFHLSLKCGSNCPGDGCTQCICGQSPFYIDPLAWCKQYSWSLGCCACVIFQQSAANAHAMQQDANSIDVGIFQIANSNWASCNGGKPPCNPSQNLNCAIQIYKWGGNTWKFWVGAEKCGCANSS